MVRALSEQSVSHRSSSGRTARRRSARRGRRPVRRSDLRRRERRTGSGLRKLFEGARTFALIAIVVGLAVGVVRIVPDLARADEIGGEYQRAAVAPLPGIPIRSVPIEFERVGEVEYRVVEGDNLSKIARFFVIDVSALVALNDLTDPDTLAVGQRLRIPASRR